ncbi:TMEM70 (predicted) [Pycnogonum litorale]
MKLSHFRFFTVCNVLTNQTTRQTINRFTNAAAIDRVGYNRQFSCRRSSSMHVKDAGDLVYEGKLTRNLKMVKYFSFTTTLIGLSIQPALLTTLSAKSSAFALTFCGFVGTITFVTPYLIHVLAKRYVTALYFDRQNKVFTAFTLSLFNREKPMRYVSDDVHIPDVTGAFSSFKAKGRPLFVADEDFNDLSVYEHMVGYDKPLDLTLPPDDNQKS